MTNGGRRWRTLLGIFSDKRVPRKGVSMRKIHDVLRLHFDLKLPHRQIARVAFPGVTPKSAPTTFACIVPFLLKWKLTSVPSVSVAFSGQ